MVSAALEKAVNEVTAALSPLPDGYFVEADEATGSILVYCKFPEPDGLGFAITQATISDGGHVDAARATFGDLMRAVETGNHDSWVH